MAGFKRFQDIIAWQLSRALNLRVDEYLARPEFKRKYKIVDQLSEPFGRPFGLPDCPGLNRECLGGRL